MVMRLTARTEMVQSEEHHVSNPVTVMINKNDLNLGQKSIQICPKTSQLTPPKLVGWNRHHQTPCYGKVERQK